MTVEQLEEILSSKEGESLEFKEAKSNYDFEKLVKYCAALANEGGGKVVLGVTDKRPRIVVGSQAFKQPERTGAFPKSGSCCNNGFGGNCHLF